MATAYGGKQYYNYYHFLDINGDFLGNIASMSYHVINVPPGKYTITGYAGLHSYEDLKTTGVKYSIEITTTANQTYYASIDEKEQTIALINEKKWQKELKKKFPVKWLSSIEYKNNTFYDT
ncbi:MAG: hypothetical protein IKC81_07115, partial [Paludibacteraceae bacterium]|nr:hypothetical protein [Paludibacteraceae bacterium]